MNRQARQAFKPQKQCSGRVFARTVYLAELSPVSGPGHPVPAIQLTGECAHCPYTLR